MSAVDFPPLTNGEVARIAQSLGFVTDSTVQQKVTDSLTCAAGMGTLSGKVLRWWGGQATTDASGNFTLNYASANFTGVVLVAATALCAGNLPAQAAQANINARSATTCAGFVTAPNTQLTSALGISFLTVANVKVPNASVDVIVFGY